MPTTYSHYRFGKEVYKKLTPAQKAIIDPYRGLFDLGLHGPDLLFYYHPFQKPDKPDRRCHPRAARHQLPSFLLPAGGEAAVTKKQHWHTSTAFSVILPWTAPVIPTWRQQSAAPESPTARSKRKWIAGTWKKTAIIP